MTKLTALYSEVPKQFNTNICYCNADTIVACAYKDSDRCPRVCRLFSGEDERLEHLFERGEHWKEDEK